MKTNINHFSITSALVEAVIHGLALYRLRLKLSSRIKVAGDAHGSSYLVTTWKDDGSDLFDRYFLFTTESYIEYRIHEMLGAVVLNYKGASSSIAIFEVAHDPDLMPANIQCLGSLY